MAKKCAHPATLLPPCPFSTDNGRLFKPVCSSCSVLPYFYRFMLNWQGAGYATAATWPAFSCHACHYYVRLGIVALVVLVAAWDWAWLWQALIRFDCLQLGQAHRKVDRGTERGVRANCLCPSLTDVQLSAAAGYNALRHKIKSSSICIKCTSKVNLRLCKDCASLTHAVALSLTHAVTLRSLGEQLACDESASWWSSLCILQGHKPEECSCWQRTSCGREMQHPLPLFTHYERGARRRAQKQMPL